MTLPLARTVSGANGERFEKIQKHSKNLGIGGIAADKGDLAASRLRAEQYRGCQRRFEAKSERVKAGLD